VDHTHAPRAQDLAQTVALCDDALRWPPRHGDRLSSSPPATRSAAAQGRRQPPARNGLLSRKRLRSSRIRSGRDSSATLAHLGERCRAVARHASC
jgi:hypothetical protein